MIKCGTFSKKMTATQNGLPSKEPQLSTISSEQCNIKGIKGPLNRRKRSKKGRIGSNPGDGEKKNHNYFFAAHPKQAI